jgi:hypothetical protein
VRRGARWCYSSTDRSSVSAPAAPDLRRGRPEVHFRPFQTISNHFTAMCAAPPSLHARPTFGEAVHPLTPGRPRLRRGRPRLRRSRPPLDPWPSTASARPSTASSKPSTPWPLAVHGFVEAVHSFGEAVHGFGEAVHPLTPGRAQLRRGRPTWRPAILPWRLVVVPLTSGWPRLRRGRPALGARHRLPAGLQSATGVWNLRTVTPDQALRLTRSAMSTPGASSTTDADRAAALVAGRTSHGDLVSSSTPPRMGQIAAFGACQW